VHGQATSEHGFIRLTRLTTALTWGKQPPSPLYYSLCLALLEILSFATSHYATGMQLVIVCNYLSHVCNYEFHIV
jgi:hypothetical protein